MNSLPFIKELIEARMFYGPDDLKNKSAKQIAEIIYLMFIMLEVIRHYKPNYTANYAVDTLKYNTYENMNYAGTDLGNLLAVLNNQDTFKAYIKSESNIAIPLFQINRYLRDLSSKSTSSHSDDVSFFWRLEDFLKLYSNSLLRQLRRDVGNWKDLTRANKEQIYLILRREFDKHSSSVDMYLWYKTNLKINEGVNNLPPDLKPNSLNKPSNDAIVNEPIIDEVEELTHVSKRKGKWGGEPSTEEELTGRNTEYKLVGTTQSGHRIYCRNTLWGSTYYAAVNPITKKVDIFLESFEENNVLSDLRLRALTKNNTLKAHNFYAFLITKLGKTLVAAEQSPGGHAVWKQLQKYHKNISIHGWLNGKPVNVDMRDPEYTHAPEFDGWDHSVDIANARDMNLIATKKKL